MMAPDLDAPDFAARRAALSPDAPAFVDHGTGRTWTFAMVDAEAQQLAGGLRAAGHPPGTRIGVLSLNRAEVFVALFAARKAGLILVPLNWRQPVAELGAIVAATGIAAVIHDTAHAGCVAALGLPGIAMSDGGGFAPLPARAAPPPAPMAETDPWYLLLTSGTTGTPKAVIQTPRMTLACAVNIAQALGIGAQDRGACYLPLFHTAGLNLFALPLFLWGGCSHILPRFDAATLLAMIDRGDVTQFFGVPTIYHAFRHHPDLARTDLGRVRGYACGGAALPVDLIAFFADRGAVICNGYGMTETGPTGFLIDRAAALTRIGSVGKPQMLTEARLDGVPDGAPGTGEILMRGATVTPGYFANPAADAAAFTSDGWLRTGDVAMRDADGYYTIVDRLKDMFISGGENVYPAEVERVLDTHPSVLESAVIGVADPAWGEVGRAFLVPRPGAVPDLAALPDWCRARLAAYKVPRSFRLLDALPRTPAGKVCKPDLRAMP
ncbi:MAG: AMP-binding protein [Gemmobacter sp.]